MENQNSAFLVLAIKKNKRIINLSTHDLKYGREEFN